MANALIRGNLFSLELYLEVPEGIEQCDINSLELNTTGTSMQRVYDVTSIRTRTNMVTGN